MGSGIKGEEKRFWVRKSMRTVTMPEEVRVGGDRSAEGGG